MSSSVNSGMAYTPQQLEQYQQLVQKRYENHIKQKKQEYAIKNTAMQACAGAIIGAGASLLLDVIPNSKAYTSGMKFAKVGKSAAIWAGISVGFNVTYALLRKVFFRNE